MKELKVVFSSCVLIILAVVLVMSSWTSSAAASKKESKPVAVKYTMPWPPGTTVIARRLDLAKRVAEKTGGKLKVELYGIGELCDSRENFEAVQTGVADVAHIISTYTPGLFPRSQLLESPVFPLPSKDPFMVAHKVLNELAPQINPEFERNGVVPSGLYWLGGVVHVYSKKPLRRLEDFKGVKISCISEVHSDCLKRLEFAPFMIPGGDTYLALQKGVIDAALQTSGGARISRYAEVVNYVTLLNWPQLGFTYVFNPRFLKSLPADLRTILVDEFKAWHEEMEIGQLWNYEKEDFKWSADRGVETIILPDEEVQRIRKRLPTMDEWVEYQKKFGMKDAKELGQTALELLEKYSKSVK
jgi:TRAP-type C4-dicarboxylate transport system substrate-binding protein